jgi:hypothetical protein
VPVVDDEPSILGFPRIGLAAAEYRVVTAGKTADALTLVRLIREQVRFDEQHDDRCPKHQPGDVHQKAGEPIDFGDDRIL